MRVVRNITPGRESCYLHGRLLFHKAFEVGWQWDDPQPFYASWRLDFSGRDHAGLRCAFQLGRFFFEFNVYDTRHWDHIANKWADPYRTPGGASMQYEPDIEVRLTPGDGVTRPK